MKKLKAIPIRFLLLLSTILLSASVAFAQKMDKASIQKAVNSGQFLFKAQTVLPMAGSTRQLNSDYEVRLSGDSLIAYLPYFGRAYSVTYGEKGGIDFTSTDFDYKVKAAKKGGWNVSIETKDVKHADKLNFSISEDGYANLQVTSNNKQPISFYGYIIEKK